MGGSRERSKARRSSEKETRRDEQIETDRATKRYDERESLEEERERERERRDARTRQGEGTEKEKDKARCVR